MSVVLISAELDEILGLADRIVVMLHGKIVAEMPISEASKERLGLAARLKLWNNAATHSPIYL